jgi:hypothetical protein
MTELQRHLTAVQQELLIRELANQLLRPKNGSGMSGASDRFERSPQGRSSIILDQEMPNIYEKDTIIPNKHDKFETILVDQEHLTDLEAQNKPKNELTIDFGLGIVGIDGTPKEKNLL